MAAMDDESFFTTEEIASAREERRREIALDCAARIIAGSKYHYQTEAAIGMAREFEKYLRGESA
jgi:hypothetical protein